MWTHLVGHGLSFLEKLGWLLKEAKSGRPKTRKGGSFGAKILSKFKWETRCDSKDMNSGFVIDFSWR